MTEPRTNPSKTLPAQDLHALYAGGRLYAVNGMRVGGPSGLSIEGVKSDFDIDGRPYVLVTVWVGSRTHPETMTGLVLYPGTPVRAADQDGLKTAIRARLEERSALRRGRSK